eukprot:TRINITY_DN30853_c0_g1_i1.p1 TRINITY_DN30853_c0_g1~~TRINITY_DN30853_c0_g1_i1.p1  ORF type:complete len:147 (-),score=31.43 TRINITY_DN30853_c0_g1_i1:186-626(-)
MIRRPPRSTHCISSAASDVYKRQQRRVHGMGYEDDLEDPDIVNEDRNLLRQACTPSGMMMNKSKICLFDPEQCHRKDSDFILLKIKVVMLGGKIVYTLDQENIDIIIAFNYSQEEIQAIQNYTETHQTVQVRSIDFLTNVIQTYNL